MKKQRRILLWLAAIFMMLSVFTTTAFAAEPTKKIVVKTAPSGVVLQPGDTRALQAVLTPATADTISAWSVSDNTVAEIVFENNSVVLKAKAPGKATVIAMAQDKTGVIGTLTVTVQNPKEITAIAIKADGMPGNKGTVNIESMLGLSESFTVQAVFEVASASYDNARNIKIASSNDNYAVVDEQSIKDITVNGKAAVSVNINILQLNKPAVITARTMDGSNKSAKFTLKGIVKTPVSKVEFNPNHKPSATVKVKEFPLKASVSASVFPINASVKNINYSSSNESVATVSNDGELTYLAPGRTVIKASSTDGSGKFVQITVNVTVDKEHLTSTLSIASQDGTYLSGESYKNVPFGINTFIKFNSSSVTQNGYAPADGSVTWKSSNSSVASVDENGVLTPKKAGTVKLTATANDGSRKSASVSISFVTEKITDFKIVLPFATMLSNTSMRLNAVSFVPSTAPVKDISWSVSPSSLAAVDSSGLLTAKKPGVVTITAKAKDGGFSKSIQINIINPIIPQFEEKIGVGDFKQASTEVFIGEGETAELFSGNSTPNASYQWYKSTLPILNDSAENAIDGATAANYSVANNNAQTKPEYYFVKVYGNEIKTSYSKLYLIVHSTEKLTDCNVTDYVFEPRLNIEIGNRLLNNVFEFEGGSGTVSWFKNTAAEGSEPKWAAVKLGEKAALGKRYKAEITVMPSKKYSVRKTTFIYNNSAAEKVSATNNLDKLTAEIIYKPIANNIETYDISAFIEAPKANELAKKPSAVPYNEYSVSLVWKYKENGTEKVLPFNGFFKTNTEYYANVTLTALGGYVFDKDKKLMFSREGQILEATDVGTQTEKKRVITLAFPATQKNAPAVVLNYETETLEKLDNTMKYKLDEGDWVSVLDNTPVNIPATAKQQKISVTLKDDSSLTAVLYAPARRPAPPVSANFSALQYTNSDNKMEYQVLDDGGNLQPDKWEHNKSLSGAYKILPEHYGKTVYFRYKAVQNIGYCSDSKAVYVPNAPTLEEGIVKIDYLNEEITGLTSAMEYTFNGENSAYTSVTQGNYTAAIPSSSILEKNSAEVKYCFVRYKKTAASPASKPIKLEIPKRARLSDNFLTMAYESESIVFDTGSLNFSGTTPSLVSYKGTTNSAMSWINIPRDYSSGNTRMILGNDDMLGTEFQFRLSPVEGISFASKAAVFKTPVRPKAPDLKATYKNDDDTIVLSGPATSDLTKIGGYTEPKYGGWSKMIAVNSSILTREAFHRDNANVYFYTKATKTALGSLSTAPITVPGKPVLIWQSYMLSGKERILSGFVNEFLLFQNQITFSLEGNRFDESIRFGLDVSSWIKNIPEGMSAILSSVNYAYDFATIEMIGIPTQPCSEPIDLVIPTEALKDKISGVTPDKNIVPLWDIRNAASLDTVTEIISDGTPLIEKGTQEVQMLTITTDELTPVAAGAITITPADDGAAAKTITAEVGDSALSIAEKIRTAFSADSQWLVSIAQSDTTSAKLIFTRTFSTDSNSFAKADTGEGKLFVLKDESEEAATNITAVCEKITAGIAGSSTSRPLQVSVNLSKLKTPSEKWEDWVLPANYLYSSLANCTDTAFKIKHDSTYDSILSEIEAAFPMIVPEISFDKTITDEGGSFVITMPGVTAGSFMPDSLKAHRQKGSINCQIPEGTFFPYGQTTSTVMDIYIPGTATYPELKEGTDVSHWFVSGGKEKVTASIVEKTERSNRIKINLTVEVPERKYASHIVLRVPAEYSACWHGNIFDIYCPFWYI